MVIQKQSTVISAARQGESASFMVHGLGNELVKPSWAPLTLAEINQVLSRFPQLGQAKELIWRSPRPFSTGAIAATADRQVFIKRHHSDVRDVAGLLEEHRFIAHLRAAGLAVSEVLTDVSGASAIAEGQWVYEVHRRAVGVDLYRDVVSWSPFFSTDHARAAGCALAQLHLAAQSYQAPKRQAQMLVSSSILLESDDLIEGIEQFASTRPALADYLTHRRWHDEVKHELVPLHQQLKPFIKALPPLWTHNDWHASNLLWSDASATANVSTVIDFGLSNQTFALYDLATAIERNLIDWLALPSHNNINLVHFDLLDALLKGYTSIRPLSQAEATALPLLLPLVHLEFALSEVLYFNSIVPSKESVTLAYDGYLLGHARWFKSIAGQQLLTYLKRC